ncbi:MAG: sensor histidine kinase N-terminal domain-containing protein [Proteobacteria bacterium]|nr:sensor histidine kinase N-terminal domain-containing protein [Pseudomonadota bacterium]
MRLRNLLLAWLLVPTLVLWGLGFAVGYERSLQQAHEAYDRTLLGSALVIGAGIASAEDGEVVLELPHAALEMLRTDAQDRIFYRVADARDGATITGYEDLPPPAAPPQAGEPVFYDAEYKGQAVRVVALAHVLPTSSSPRRLLVQVAETLDARRRLTRRIVADSSLVQLLLILTAAGLIALGVQRGLAPLARLREDIRQRAANDLEPIATAQVPAEVRPLIDAINTHTGRQRELSQAQVRFVANASHQLKTPLTVLRAQIGHALMQTSLPAMRSVVEELDASTDATGRLVEQLLSLARSEPGRALVAESLDLSELARSVSFGLLAEAGAKGVDLGLAADEAVPVHGERLLLREMVLNLVHNAVVYSPPGGVVTVHVLRRGSGGRACLEVIDNGPGIAPEQRARAFERFYRLPSSNTKGSGLGLAIVREICARHGIEIALGDGEPNASGGHGLRVTLLWSTPYTGPEAGGSTA